MFKKLITKPQFSVNENGDVMWNDTKTVLTPFKDKDGYLRYCYRINGKNYHLAQHRAVAEAFVPNPDKSKYKIVNHLNSDVADNAPSNLEWTNPRGNKCHSELVGNVSAKGENHSQNKINESSATQICELLSKGLRQVDIAKLVGLPLHYVKNIKHGKSWTHISRNYKLGIPKKSTVSLSTLEWLREQSELGKDIEELLKLNKSFSEADRKRIKELV